MGAQTILDISPSALCQRMDHWLSCHGRTYARYHDYIVGPNPDISKALRVERLRRVMCEGGCGLCPDEIDRLSEHINVLLS